MKQVTVLIGAGSIGLAIARSISAGKHILLADLKKENTDAVAKTLCEAGFEVTTTTVDISSRADGEKLASQASGLGEVMHLIQAPVAAVLKVDLYGTALILEVFGNIISKGGTGVVISSQTGYRMAALTEEQNRALATTPADELLSLPFLKQDLVKDTLHAYQLSKRGNGLRVMAEAVKWGKRGARINSNGFSRRFHHRE